jgi:hypothetical protein
MRKRKQLSWGKALSLHVTVVVLSALFAGTAVAQTASADSQAASSNHTKSQSVTPSAADIAAAKANGKVWVNLDTAIYHKGGRWYGKTKNGKFMSVDEANKAGYKAAKRD